MLHFQWSNSIGVWAWEETNGALVQSKPFCSIYTVWMFVCCVCILISASYSSQRSCDQAASLRHQAGKEWFGSRLSAYGDLKKIFSWYCLWEKHNWRTGFNWEQRPMLQWNPGLGETEEGMSADEGNQTSTQSSRPWAVFPVCTVSVQRIQQILLLKRLQKHMHLITHHTFSPKASPFLGALRLAADHKGKRECYAADQKRVLSN